MKLSEIVRISPLQSALDVQCELDPKHPMTKKYANIEISRTVIVRIEDIDKPMDVNFTLRACPLCIASFAYDVAHTARDLNVRKSA